MAALANLLLLNRTGRALLLYGTLAHYQRDLRALPVALNVSNVPAADVAMADIAGMSAARWLAAKAPRPDRKIDLRAQRYGPGSPDEGQRQTAPMPMREQRHTSGLMAVFIRPAACLPSGTPATC